MQVKHALLTPMHGVEEPGTCGHWFLGALGAQLLKETLAPEECHACWRRLLTPVHLPRWEVSNPFMHKDEPDLETQVLSSLMNFKICVYTLVDG